ncbi:hypothetical protein IWW47_004614 [Coemansia sp. RSA 2052]|nr:hypothetical protein IWW47_004614 [Coemansia sp. RSA 2052]
MTDFIVDTEWKVKDIREMLRIRHKLAEFIENEFTIVVKMYRGDPNEGGSILEGKASVAPEDTDIYYRCSLTQ